VDIRGRRVYAELDPEGIAAPQAAIQILSRNNVHRVSVDSLNFLIVSH